MTTKLGSRYKIDIHQIFPRPFHQPSPSMAFIYFSAISSTTACINCNSSLLIPLYSFLPTASTFHCSFSALSTHHLHLLIFSLHLYLRITSYFLYKMAARTLDRMRKAQSLIRECHEWVSHNYFCQFHFKFHANFIDEKLVQSNEMLLAVELCQIEGRLALFFENRCFANSPCPGLQQEELPRLVSTECSMTDKYVFNTDIMSPTAPIQWLQAQKPPWILQRVPQSSPS